MAHNNQYTKNADSQSKSSTRGGTPEQHAKAGQQSHKNIGNSSSSSSNRNAQGEFKAKR